jgi:hypothetical protein
LLGVFGILSAVAFVYMGARLPALVASDSGVVPRILAVTCVYLALLLVLGLASGSAGTGLVVQASLGLVITWYLFRNFRRLAGEASSAARRV